MYKIAFEYFQKMIEKKPSGREIDFLIYLSRIQSGSGKIIGVYYRDVCAALGISIQKFYDLLAGLQEKELITVEHHYYGDYDIRLCGNDFSKYTDQDYKEGRVRYINTNHRLFTLASFKRLRATEKLLVMDLFNITLAAGKGAFQIGRMVFLEKYASVFGISKRTVQSYLKYLQLFFQIFLKGKKYIILIRDYMREKVVGNKKRIRETEQDACETQILTASCRRNHIKQPEEKEWKDTKALIRQYGAKALAINMTELIRQTLEILNVAVPKKEAQRRLKASLIHRELRAALLQIN